MNDCINEIIVSDNEVRLPEELDHSNVKGYLPLAVSHIIAVFFVTLHLERSWPLHNILKNKNRYGCLAIGNMKFFCRATIAYFIEAKVKNIIWQWQ